MELNDTFLKLYCKENKMKCSLRNSKYTIALDKKHKKWFETDKLTVDTTHVKGLFDTLFSKYMQTPIFASLKTSNDGLEELNEILIDQGIVQFNVEEKQGNAVYCLFEVMIQTVREKQRKIVPTLMIENQVQLADEFELKEYRQKKELKLQNIDKMVQSLNQILSKDIELCEKQHEKAMKELLEIQRQHNEDQFKELQKEENAYDWKIEEMRELGISATSFDAQRNYAKKAKDLRRKKEQMIAKNKKIREKVIDGFENEVSALKKREISVSAEVLCYANIDIDYYLVHGEKEYLYVPLINKFWEKT